MVLQPGFACGSLALFFLAAFLAQLDQKSC
jgi:hypothetical protein